MMIALFSARYTSRVGDSCFCGFPREKVVDGDCHALDAVDFGRRFGGEAYAMKKARGAKSFGAVLREKRMAKKITLRKFAEMIGVSATYLSQVEQDHFAPPTADRVTKIAELLGEDSDEWIRLADRVPDDVYVLVRQHPKDMPDLMRLASGLSRKPFEVIKEQIRKMKKRGK